MIKRENRFLTMTMKLKIVYCISGKNKIVRPSTSSCTNVHRSTTCVSCQSNVEESYRCVNRSSSPLRLQHLFTNETEVLSMCQKCLSKESGDMKAETDEKQNESTGGDSQEFPGTFMDQGDLACTSENNNQDLVGTLGDKSSTESLDDNVTLGDTDESVGVESADDVNNSQSMALNGTVTDNCESHGPQGTSKVETVEPVEVLQEESLENDAVRPLESVGGLVASSQDEFMLGESDMIESAVPFVVGSDGNLGPEAVDFLGIGDPPLPDDNGVTKDSEELLGRYDAEGILKDVLDAKENEELIKKSGGLKDFTVEYREEKSTLPDVAFPLVKESSIEDADTVVTMETSVSGEFSGIETTAITKNNAFEVDRNEESGQQSVCEEAGTSLSTYEDVLSERKAKVETDGAADRKKEKEKMKSDGKRIGKEKNEGKSFGREESEMKDNREKESERKEIGEEKNEGKSFGREESEMKDNGEKESEMNDNGEKESERKENGKEKNEGDGIVREERKGKIIGKDKNEGDGFVRDERKGEIIGKDKNEGDGIVREEKKGKIIGKDKNEGDGFVREEKKGKIIGKDKNEEDGFVREERKGKIIGKDKNEEDGIVGEESERKDNVKEKNEDSIVREESERKEKNEEVKERKDNENEETERKSVGKEINEEIGREESIGKDIGKEQSERKDIGKESKQESIGKVINERNTIGSEESERKEIEEEENEEKSIGKEINEGKSIGKEINEGKSIETEESKEKSIGKEESGGKECKVASEKIVNKEEELSNENKESGLKESAKDESSGKRVKTASKSPATENDAVKENDKRLRQRRTVATAKTSPAKSEKKTVAKWHDKTRGALLKKQKAAEKEAGREVEREAVSETTQGVKRKNEKRPGRGKKAKVEDCASNACHGETKGSKEESMKDIHKGSPSKRMKTRKELH